MTYDPVPILWEMQGRNFVLISLGRQISFRGKPWPGSTSGLPLFCEVSLAHGRATGLPIDLWLLWDFKGRVELLRQRPVACKASRVYCLGRHRTSLQTLARAESRPGFGMREGDTRWVRTSREGVEISGNK